MSISITEVVRKSKQTPPALRKRGLFEGSESFIAKFAVVFVLYWGKDVEREIEELTTFCHKCKCAICT